MLCDGANWSTGATATGGHGRRRQIGGGGGGFRSGWRRKQRKMMELICSVFPFFSQFCFC